MKEEQQKEEQQNQNDLIYDVYKPFRNHDVIESKIEDLTESGMIDKFDNIDRINKYLDISLFPF